MPPGRTGGGYSSAPPPQPQPQTQPVSVPAAQGAYYPPDYDPTQLPPDQQAAYQNATAPPPPPLDPGLLQTAGGYGGVPAAPAPTDPVPLVPPENTYYYAGQAPMQGGALGATYTPPPPPQYDPAFDHNYGGLPLYAGPSGWIPTWSGQSGYGSLEASRIGGGANAVVTPPPTFAGAMLAGGGGPVSGNRPVGAPGSPTVTPPPMGPPAPQPINHVMGQAAIPSAPTSSWGAMANLPPTVTSLMPGFADNHAAALRALQQSPAGRLSAAVLAPATIMEDPGRVDRALRTNLAPAINQALLAPIPLENTQAGFLGGGPTLAELGQSLNQAAQTPLDTSWLTGLASNAADALVTPVGAPAAPPVPASTGVDQIGGTTPGIPPAFHTGDLTPPLMPDQSGGSVWDALGNGWRAFNQMAQAPITLPTPNVSLPGNLDFLSQPLLGSQPITIDPGAALRNRGTIQSLATTVNPTQSVPAYTTANPALRRSPISHVGDLSAPAVVATPPARAGNDFGQDVLNLAGTIKDTLGAGKDALIAQIAGQSQPNGAAPASGPAFQGAASPGGGLAAAMRGGWFSRPIVVPGGTIVGSDGTHYPVTIQADPITKQPIMVDDGKGGRKALPVTVTLPDGSIQAYPDWFATQQAIKANAAATTPAAGDTVLPVNGTVVAGADSGGSGGGGSNNDYAKKSDGSGSGSGSSSQSRGRSSAGGPSSSNRDGIYHVVKSDGSRVTIDLNNLPDEVKNNDAFMALLKKDPSAAAKLLADHGYGLARGKGRGARARRAGLGANGLPVVSATPSTNGRTGPLANAIFDRYFEVANKPMPPTVAKAVIDSLPATSAGGASAGKRRASTGGGRSSGKQK